MWVTFRFQCWASSHFYYRQFSWGLLQSPWRDDIDGKSCLPESQSLKRRKLKQLIYWFNWINNLKIIDDKKAEERAETTKAELAILNFWLRKIIRHNFSDHVEEWNEMFRLAESWYFYQLISLGYYFAFHWSLPHAYSGFTLNAIRLTRGIWIKWSRSFAAPRRWLSKGLNPPDE